MRDPVQLRAELKVDDILSDSREFTAALLKNPELALAVMDIVRECTDRLSWPHSQDGELLASRDLINASMKVEGMLCRIADRERVAT